MANLLSGIFDGQLACVILWVAIFAIALVVELATEQLVSVWFCGGAVASVVLAVCKVDFTVQVIVFVALSAALLAFGKIFLAKKLVKRDQKTNYDALLGDKILITERVTPESYGAGKYRDVVWTVASADVIEVGEFAVVKEINGNKLIVKKEVK